MRSDRPKSVLDVIAWCQELEARLGILEKGGYQISDIGEFILDECHEIASGSGDRSFQQSITFETELTSPPKIFTSLSGLNVESGVNTAVELEVKNVTKAGAEIHVKTWNEASVPFVKVSWLAITSSK